MFTPGVAEICRGRLENGRECRSDFCQFKLRIADKPSVALFGRHECLDESRYGVPKTNETTCIFREKEGYVGPHLLCSYKFPSDPNDLGKLFVPLDTGTKDYYKHLKEKEYDPKDPCPGKCCSKPESPYQKEPFLVHWPHGVHDWMCQGGPMLTPSAKAKCNESDWQYCDFCQFTLTFTPDDKHTRSRPLQGTHGCWNSDKHPGEPNPPDERTCKMKDTGELVCTYKGPDPSGDPSALGNLPIEASNPFYEKVYGKEYDPKDCPGKCCGMSDDSEYQKEAFLVFWRHGVHDWMCQGGPILTPSAKAKCMESEWQQYCGKIQIRIMFYRRVQGKEFNPSDPPCPKPVSCYGGAGVWKSLQDWECQGSPLKPPPGTTVNDRAVVYLVTCDDDWRYDKDLCSFDITPRSAEDTNEEMNVHFWCLEQRHYALTPSATSSTPVCRLHADTDGRPIPSLRCSYKPGKDPKKTFETVTVSKKDMKKFRDAVYKAKVWSEDKKGDETCLKWRNN